MRKSAERRCRACHAVLVRQPNEKAFYSRSTCGAQECIDAYREATHAKFASARPAVSEGRTLGEWPDHMAKPFADNASVPPWSPTRMPGGAALAGGCSSSSGWDVGGLGE